MYDRKHIHNSDPYRKLTNNEEKPKNIYYGEVVSIDDSTQGGRIKVRVPDLDKKIRNESLPYCYPMLPKFFWLYPKVGEVVRVFIADLEKPQSTRHWIGSIISQPQKFEYDSYYNALSTTNLGISSPAPAPRTFPNAEGVFPNINDVAIVGRVNTDIILRENEVELRAGKHQVDDILTLNKQNPSTIKITIENDGSRSSNITIADKIALISHDGVPQFPATNIDREVRDKIFEEGHPMTRGDILLEALEIIRTAILNHIHPYDKLPADKSNIILDLENIDFEAILQRNIVIN
ncbi:MAG: hypothetical protein ACOCVF_01755 [bacterium]